MSVSVVEREGVERVKAVCKLENGNFDNMVENVSDMYNIWQSLLEKNDLVNVFVWYCLVIELFKFTENRIPSQLQRSRSSKPLFYPKV